MPKEPGSISCSYEVFDYDNNGRIIGSHREFEFVPYPRQRESKTEPKEQRPKTDRATRHNG